MKSKSFTTYRFMLSLGAFVVLMLFCVSALGQGQGFTAIRGSIKDPQGAVVAGATVTLTNTETNTPRTTTSNDSGQFAFEGIQPGVYRVEVEAKGFKKAVLNQVPALVSKPTDVGDVAMEIGDLSETISVTVGAGEALINTQDASLGNNFVSQQITQLPLNARNVANLLSLQPAVTPSGYVAGGRSDQANITLDGVDVNEQQTGDAFSPVLRVSPDTVEEFRVTTTNPNASQGRSSGAQVELVTKQGSNEWHGNLFEYHRNTVTTANDFFNNSTIEDGKSLPRPVLLRNNFGGSLSGPIMKDRFFFFYNYEGRRDARQVPVNRTVPLATLGQGLLRFRTTRSNGSAGPVVTLTTADLNSLTTSVSSSTGLPTGTPLVDLNPVTVEILRQAAARYPSNNCRLGDCLNTGGFQFNASVPADLKAHVLRLDFNITKDAKHIGYFRGNYQQDVTGGSPQFPDTLPTQSWSHPYGFVAGHTWTISNDKINNFRYGLTREAFTNSGDSNVNAITFRSVFSSNLFARSFSRTTPTHNITDDFSWIKGNHSLGFGTNLRLVRNNRESFGPAFDNGITNQSFYAGSGNVLTNPINAHLGRLTGIPGLTIASNFVNPTRHAFASLIGRLSQYTANFNFNVDGTPLAINEPVVRSFATEELDVYAQDIWKMRDNFTLTYGLRYGLSRPVYERNGFQSRPSVGLAEYLEKRFAAAERGENFTDPLTVVLAGPKHDAPGFYPLDKNNFQPRAAVAWSPAFRSGFFGTLFGTEKQSVFRGGFAITNDYFGQALAVNFDGNNTLGFNPSTTPSANTFNVTTRPGPPITGLGMSIRGLPFINPPTSISFPQTQPQDFQRRIEGSLDTNLVSPINYSWNFTYGRQFGKGIYVEASYIARLARNLLATRDVMQLNNLVDPKSGQDWYTAANILEQFRVAGRGVQTIPNVPFFENLYAAGLIDDVFFGTGVLTNTQAAYALMADDRHAGCEPGGFVDVNGGGCGFFGDDWTFLQDVFDRFTGRRLFFQSQYGALSAFGTIASSDYHGATVSVRQRMRGLTWDFNYTFSKSIDDASGLQSSGVFGSAFITNALRQRDNRGVSDFDITHIVNFNSIWDLPFGRGRRFFTDSNRWVNGILGGWTLTSIVRYNSGLPVSSPVDVGGWPTNWNVRSWAVPIKDIKASPTRGGNGKPANLFSDVQAAYNSFRSPAPGETGARNILRGMGFFSLDAGLSKSFGMPWSENHKLTIRWETFNVTNTQYLTGNADVTNGLDPQFGSPGPTFYNFTSIQGNPRIMQFALRYDF